MGIKDKMKTYNFWISLVSALLLVARILGTKYGFSIDSGLVMDVTTAMCSVFVILGIISAPQKVVTQIKTEYKTPVKEETNEEDISDVGSVVSPAEFITPIALEPQILEPEKEDDGEPGDEIPASSAGVTVSDGFGGHRNPERKKKDASSRSGTPFSGLRNGKKRMLTSRRCRSPGPT